MPKNDKAPGSKPRVNYLRRRPRPGALARPHEGNDGALVRPPDGGMSLPHERDETRDMTDGQVPAEGKQAHEDLERGLQDTSKSVEMDRTYRRQRD